MKTTTQLTACSTDRGTVQIPTPFADWPAATALDVDLLPPHAPRAARRLPHEQTMHVLHHGRAEYSLIHPGRTSRIQRVVMGRARRDGAERTPGERPQLHLGTGVWKMSRLLDADVRAAMTGDARARTGCLITEVATPGFVWEDHALLTRAELVRVFEGVEAGMEWVKELERFMNKG